MTSHRRLCLSSLLTMFACLCIVVGDIYLAGIPELMTETEKHRYIQRSVLEPSNIPLNRRNHEDTRPKLERHWNTSKWSFQLKLLDYFIMEK